MHFTTIPDPQLGPLPDSSNFSPGILQSKISVGKSGTYVLHSATISDSEPKFAVALSDNSVKVYDAKKNIFEGYGHKRSVSDLKFSKSQPNCIFTSSVDGEIIVWDLRCREYVQSFKDDSDGQRKPLLCFDFSADELLLCAGTEVIREDSFLLFWDQRSSDILGGYWNSHTDDITQVKFHPTKKTYMVSSSVDGLMNVFDLKETTEDDALMHTCNVESAIHKCCWRTSKYEEDYLCCTTTIDEFQLWSYLDASPTVRISKEELLRETGKEIDYMIDNLKIGERWYLASGNHLGTVYLCKSGKKHIDPTGFLLEGHTDTVRTICYNAAHSTVLTGGEDGCVCLWKVADKLSL